MEMYRVLDQWPTSITMREDGLLWLNCCPKYLYVPIPRKIKKFVWKDPGGQEHTGTYDELVTYVTTHPSEFARVSGELEHYEQPTTYHRVRSITELDFCR